MPSTLRIAAFAAVLTMVSSSYAGFNDPVTPDVIFGSGNANGNFTVDQAAGIELGLRAKLRFDDTNQPQNIFNNQGNGTYLFEPGLPPTGFGFAAGSPSTATWNFEWSVNSNFDGSNNGLPNGGALNDFTYQLFIDFDPAEVFDPGAATTLAFDPINQPAADHALGDNSTGNGGGISDLGTYAANIQILNVAQNSWNMEFFNDNGNFFFDPTIAGATYTIRLDAYAGGAPSPIASTQINVVTTPEPSTLAMFALGGVGVFFVARRRRNVQAEVEEN